MENKKKLTKMYVLPEETFNKWKSSVEHINTFSPFDCEMKRILYNKKLSDLNKWYLYRQNLLKYAEMKRRGDKKEEKNASDDNSQYITKKSNNDMSTSMTSHEKKDATSQTRYIAKFEKGCQSEIPIHNDAGIQAEVPFEEIYSDAIDTTLDENTEIDPRRLSVSSAGNTSFLLKNSSTPVRKISASGAANKSFLTKRNTPLGNLFKEVNEKASRQTELNYRAIKKAPGRFVRNPVYTPAQSGGKKIKKHNISWYRIP